MKDPVESTRMEAGRVIASSIEKARSFQKVDVGHKTPDPLVETIWKGLTDLATEDQEAVLVRNFYSLRATH